MKAGKNSMCGRSLTHTNKSSKKHQLVARSYMDIVVTYSIPKN